MKSILDLKDFESLSANEQIHLVGAFSPIEVAVSSDSDDTSREFNKQVQIYLICS